MSGRLRNIMRKLSYSCFLALLLAFFSNCQGVSGNSGGGNGGTPPPPPQTANLTVNVSGTGNVTSKPKGIDCPTTCKASFNQGTKVTLTATPGSGSSQSWSGACSGNA